MDHSGDATLLTELGPVSRNLLSTFFLDSAVYEQRKECFLRRLLKDRSGTTPIEVNNFDTSKRSSLHSALRADVIRKPGPGQEPPGIILSTGPSS